MQIDSKKATKGMAPHTPTILQMENKILFSKNVSAKNEDTSFKRI